MVGLMGWGVTDENGWRKGPWTPEEDKLLSDYIGLHGDGRWSSVARFAGLNRSGKSCRLRWVNYLKPGLKRGNLTPQEEGIVIELHALWGNKWSTIARYLPGRTDNEIKNYWRTHFKKRAKPSQRRERRKFEAFRHKKCQIKEENIDTKNNHMSTNNTDQHGTEYMKTNEILVAEPQGNQEVIMCYDICATTTMTTTNDEYSPQSNNNYCQDVASWSDSISDDDLWGNLWSLEELVMCIDNEVY